MLNAFKIVEIVDGRTRTLFHAGGTGSRYVPMNTWIRAYEGMVMDGSRQEPYRAGHHFFIDHYVAEAYLDAFRNRPELLHVVPVQVRVIRRKPNGRPGVYLARWIRYISDEEIAVKSNLCPGCGRPLPLGVSPGRCPGCEKDDPF